MIFRTPEIHGDENDVLELLAEQREQLRDRVAEPRRWSGTLRKMAFARAVQGSNGIEGYNASLDDVVAAVEGEPTLDADEKTQHALAGYRDAMTYVLQIADDESLQIDEGLIKSLHFMMIKHDLDKNPGQWRPGSVYVVDEEGQAVYEGPPSDQVPELVAELLAELRRDPAPALVRAAMAHLNLTLIHPFSDGNGRMARCPHATACLPPSSPASRSFSVAIPTPTTRCWPMSAPVPGTPSATRGRGFASAYGRTSSRSEPCNGAAPRSRSCGTAACAWQKATTYPNAAQRH
jgi:hypothetical protein